MSRRARAARIDGRSASRRRRRRRARPSRRRSGCSTAASSRVAEPDGDGWRRQRVGRSRRSCSTSALREMETIEVGPFEFHDKIPLKRGYAERGVRVVPPGDRRATARSSSRRRRADAQLREHRRLGRPGHDGRHLGHRRLVRADRRATCTSRAASASAACSSRRRRAPVIVEDGAFLGSRCDRRRGRARRRARPCSARTSCSPRRRRSSTSPAQGPVEHRGRGAAAARSSSRARAEGVPGRRLPAAGGADHRRRSASHDLKTSLNEALRDARRLQSERCRAARR